MITYSNIIKVLEAYPIANFTVSNLTPLVGETVLLTNTSKYEESIAWTLNTGTSTTNPTGESVSLAVNSAGKLDQLLTATNTITSVSKTKSVFGLQAPNMAYCTFSLNKEVARIGESITITITNLFGYSDSFTHQLVITKHSDGNVYRSVPITNGATFTIDVLDIYDVELQTTSGSNVCYFQLPTILTITPALAPKASAVVFEMLDVEAAKLFYGVSYSLCDGANFNYTHTTIPAGSTIFVKKAAAFNNNLASRLYFSNLIGTAEQPIVITFDTEDDFFYINFASYYGLLLGNCQHVYIDGRGYGNRELGVKLTPKVKDDGLIGISVGQKSSNIDISHCEIYKTNFCGVQAKTDPDSADYTTWRGNFFMNDFHLHHMYVHETLGEGFYIGYYSTGYLGTGIDGSGNTVQYRAHSLPNAKIYRNYMYRCGWDSIQAGNLTANSEITCNTIVDSAWYGVADQNSCMSVTMEGKLSNNIIRGHHQGIGIQIGFFGETHIYNNLITGLPEGVGPIYLLSDNGCPEQNVNNFENTIPIYIYNNDLMGKSTSTVVTAQNVCQYKGLVFKNNLYSCTNTIPNIFGGQSTDTIAVWNTNASNNIRYEDFTNDVLLILDADTDNFNIFIDSKLKNGGTIMGSTYDLRGFKNWYSASKFIGAYSEFVKSDVVTPTISNLVATNTSNNSYDITFDHTSTILEYMIDENSSFTNGVWTDYVDTATIVYNLLNTMVGDKTIYFKVRNNTGESNVINTTVTYSEAKRYIICLSNYVTYSLGLPASYNRMVVGSSEASTIPIPLITLTGLKDQYSNVSGLSARTTSQFDDYGDNNSLGIDNNILYYPQAKIRSWRILKTGSLTGIGTVKIENCDDTKSYEVRLFAYRYGLGAAQSFTVNGVSQTWDAGGNPEATCLFSNITLNVDNSIDVSVACTPSTGDYGAFLAVIDIKES